MILQLSCAGKLPPLPAFTWLWYTINMVEIELKAHVQDVADLVSRLASFAQFQRCCYKSDTYWKEPHKQVQIRIREEKNFFTEASCFHAEQWPLKTEDFPADCSSQLLVTYKRKELMKNSFEVNQEQEFQVDKREPLELFLQDAGFAIHLKKEKLVAAWQWDEVLLELCFIPELGNFLELEVLCQSQAPQVVSSAHQRLRQVLFACGIEEAAIEGRYYSQLLQEVRS